MRFTLIDTPQIKITFTQTAHAPIVSLPVVRVQFFGSDFVGWGRVDEVLAAHGLAASTAWRGGLSFDGGYTAKARSL